MTTISWDTFERYRQKGLDARRAGQWDSARVYLLEAARAMVELGKQSPPGPIQDGRRDIADKLLELAKDCARPRPAGTPAVEAESNSPASSTSADPWMVKDKGAIKFDDVAGLEDVKQDIRLKMIYPFRHPDLAAKFGIRAGGGVLLYGPPGTGKTMLARATAGEIDAAFYVVSAADMLSKWVGEAEQNIKKLFDSAASQPRSIIFIDEIESLVPARRDEGSSVMQRVVPQILQGMEGFGKNKSNPVLFMGATNVPWQLDPAVLRPGRFDEKVYIPLPDVVARRKMLDLYLTHRPVSADVDLDRLAERLDGYSGADIRYACDRAATIPFLQSVATGEVGEITPAVIDAALADVPKTVTPSMIERFDRWARDGAD